jgi:2-polyprenyl-6-methoxyphenol hydroxylase-like FAD-dependent oxidoreductase
MARDVLRSSKSTHHTGDLPAERGERIGMHTGACDVAIVGGGLAGASAAFAFAQQGCSVRLFERRDLARDPNRGDILHPPTVAVVRRLGLLDVLDARGAIGLRQVTVVSPDGQLATQPHTEEYRILNHAEMEAVILDAADAQGATVHNDPVRSLVRDGDSPDAGWLVETDNGTTRARLLVGADGADSLTRRTLGIEYAEVHEYDHWIVVLHANRPSWLEPESGWTLYHPDGAVFILPTTPEGRIRVIVIVPREEAKEWMTSSEAELARRLGERHPNLGGLDVTKRGGSHVYRLKRTHAERYTGPHVALVGDAAHTTHTMGGQGLNIAIQDSVKLAEIVEPVLQDADATEDALASALKEYEEIRRPINTATLKQADWASQMAGPGQEAYEFALDFYAKAAEDPNFLRRFAERFGGKE